MDAASRTPPLLYLPGLDGTGLLLHRQPRLFERYDVRALAYPQDRSVTYDELTDLAEALLGADDPSAVVLAESFGGGVALHLALRRPEAVARLVLVNTFAYLPRRFLLRLGVLLGRFVPDTPMPALFRFSRAYYLFGSGVPRSEHRAWKERTGNVSMRAMARRSRLIASLDLRPRLAEIQTPTVVVSSRDDRVVPWATGRDLASRLPHASFVSVNAGHAALIHPSVDVASLLDDPALWKSPASR